MATLITDTTLSDQLIEQRRATGTDRWDETWEGIYMMTPMPNDEHQDIVGALTSILYDVIQKPKLGRVRPGVNVTDREDDWTTNYRCPDVVVYLNDNTAECRDTHWLGGPDFLVEVISRDDRTRDKLGFYGEVGTLEVLLVDRDPWSLELWRPEGDQLQLATSSTLEGAETLVSDVVPLTFQLVPGPQRPVIAIASQDGQRTWQV